MAERDTDGTAGGLDHFATTVSYSLRSIVFAENQTTQPIGLWGILIWSVSSMATERSINAWAALVDNVADRLPQQISEKLIALTLESTGLAGIRYPERAKSRFSLVSDPVLINSLGDSAVGIRKPVVAITHDYLTQKGGAERVVLAMHRAFPEAKIYTTLYHPEGTYPEFAHADIVTSQLNRIPFFRKNHRSAFPFLAPASSSLRIPADIVLSSSSGWAHGFTTKGQTLVYCHSPARWLYLTEQYIGKSKKNSPAAMVARILGPALRRWDRRAAARADVYVANSTVVQERINEVYGMDVDIMHPPHSVDTAGIREPIAGLEDFVSGGGHYLVVSRLLPYKNVDQAVQAFRGLAERLLVIGAGPMLEELKASAPPNVRFASNVTDAQMRWCYASAAAVIAPSHEDFGITPLEGAAWGKPTIALRAGGYLDTIVEGTTGVFIEEPTAACIRSAVERFEEEDWNPQDIKDHVEGFSEDIFRKRLHAGVATMVAAKSVA